MSRSVLPLLPGRRRIGAPDLVDLLTECHERIRRFTALAREAASRQDVPSEQISGACADVERYFKEALPLHVADEEQSITPRLRGLSPEVDQALDAMESQHHEHAPKIAALLRMLAEVGTDPGDQNKRSALARVAADLELDFAEHLALEEAILFPAVREMLPRETQTRVIEELRQRRRGVGPHSDEASPGAPEETSS